jgi:hypothetical protein
MIQCCHFSPRLSAHILCLLIAAVLLPKTALSNPTAEVWQEYLEARNQGTESLLPDFSYSGYHRAERPIPDIEGPIFDVTDFGAVPDDDQSDEEAIRGAIAAAEEAGGGVVFFPPGKYLVWTDRANRETIYIRHPNIVLRGSGSRKGGTVIHQIHDGLPEVDPEEGYTMRAMGADLFRFELENRETRRLSEITADASRLTYEVSVADPAAVKPGQWVRVRFGNNKATPYMLHPYEPRPEWTRIIKLDATIDEVHQVREIEGNIVRFQQPLQTEVRTEYEPFLESYTVLEEVGVEDLTFMGGWIGHFDHHRSGLDDYAWNPLRFEGVANVWVRRCTFINVSMAVNMFRASHASILQVTTAGAEGHVIISPRGGYGVLVGLSEDVGNYWHGPTAGYRSVSTVYWRYRMSPHQMIDMHSTRPYATLLDMVEGGSMAGSGGGVIGFPNHLRWLVAWNFSHGGDSGAEYSFWGDRPWFVKPFLVGLHGNPVRVDEETVKTNESQGQSVSPESLYEAQLAHRLGTIPAWVGMARREWEELRQQPLPDHLHPTRILEAESSHQHIERFDVEPFLADVALLPLRRGAVRGISATTSAKTGEIESDWVQLRQALYNLMIYAHEYGPAEIQLRAQRLVEDEQEEILFEVEPHQGNPPAENRREPDLQSAKDLAQLLQGDLTINAEGDRTIFRLRLPVRRASSDQA